MIIKILKIIYYIIILTISLLTSMSYLTPLLEVAALTRDTYLLLHSPFCANLSNLLFLL